MALEMALESEGVVRLPVGLVRPGVFQPRRIFDEEELAALAESIRQHGIIQPVIVRPVGDGYELVAGERRWRAAQMAGLEEIPAVVRPMPDQEAALVSLVENVQRESLHFFEEAEGYQRLLREFGLTQEELAEKVGRTQSSIANKLRLLRLAPEVREVISREMISERHARALLRLNSTERQLAALEEAVRKRLTVRELEGVVERLAREEEGADGGGARGRRRYRGIVRDVRIVINAFKQAVEAGLAAGVDVTMSQVVGEEFVELHVKIRNAPAAGRGR